MMWAEEELGGADLGDIRLKQQRVLLPDRPWGSSLLQESPRPVDIWRKYMPGVCGGHREADIVEPIRRARDLADSLAMTTARRARAPRR